MKKYPNNYSLSSSLLALTTLLYGQYAFGAELNLDLVGANVFGPIIRWLDNNMKMLIVLGASGGAIASPGDMRAKAGLALNGMGAAAVVWAIAHTIAVPPTT